MNVQRLTPTLSGGKGVMPPSEVSTGHVIALVRGLLKQSLHRIEAYPFAQSYQSNLALINTALVAMNDAEAVHNNKYRVKVILLQRRTLQMLAPRSPIKWRQTYMDKVEGIMSACNEYLGWEAQQ